MAKPPSLKLLKLCGGSALYLRAADRTLLPQPLKQKRFARAGKGKSRHRWRRYRAIERFTMKQILRSDSVCNGLIVYSLHRGRSRRALVRVVSDCCGLYRVAWLDIGTATSATGRTQHQESAFRALHGDGGFSSWERVLRAAQTHNRKEILSNACVELYRLAAKANVSRVQVADWATEQGQIF